MEGIDAAVSAEVVLRGRGAELVQAQCIVVDLDMQFAPGEYLARHGRPFARADRTIAAQGLRDGLLDIEPKTHRAAVAATIISGHALLRTCN